LKTKIVAYPVIAAFVVFIISCNDIGKSSVDKSLPAKKEKTGPRLTKVKKKKEKNIQAPVIKKKDEPLPVKSQSSETETSVSPGNAPIINLLTKEINSYAVQNGFSTEYCFLVDMSLPSGRNRFFVYNLAKNSVVYSGLVSHGSCNQTFISHARFSNDLKSGCSSLGKYKVGEFYNGKYGKSFRLYGLDNCNSNAYKRAVVIHGYDCVPDEEIYPRVLCNSLGCVMVSYKFFDRISNTIRKSEKPIILWVYQ
jgi:hypothetical protein